MLGQRQVMPRWENDPVRIHDILKWRGCWGKREEPPLEGHPEVGREGEAEKVKSM